MFHGCGKCSTVNAVLLLIFGVLFLLRDLNIWDFWNISWWTVVFVLAGVGGLAMSKCGSCGESKGKK
ncbi:hypothetical protein CL617_05155 [archaeon]|nr:hypothetical protein [archaeon]|tara:strand:+ start:843 stop:1043 length:201 start_codon:yes stop_codon:yes gene_type:complete